MSQGGLGGRTNPCDQNPRRCRGAGELRTGQGRQFAGDRHHRARRRVHRCLRFHQPVVRNLICEGGVRVRLADRGRGHRLDHGRGPAGRAVRRLLHRQDRPLQDVHGRHDLLRGGRDRLRGGAQPCGADLFPVPDGTGHRPGFPGGAELHRRVHRHARQGPVGEPVAGGVVHRHRRELRRAAAVLLPDPGGVAHLAVADRGRFRRGAGFAGDAGAAQVHAGEPVVGGRSWGPARSGGDPAQVLRHRRPGGAGRAAGAGRRDHGEPAQLPGAVQPEITASGRSWRRSWR